MDRNSGPFAFQWRIQKWIMELPENQRRLRILNKVYTVSWFASMASMVLIVSAKSQAFIAMLFITGGCHLGSKLLLDSFHTLTSIKGILTTGFFTSIITGIFLAFFIWEAADYSIDSNGQYLLLCVCCTAAWVFISSFFNAQIATLVNGISGSLLGLIMSSKRIFWLYLSPSLLRNLSPADLAAFQERGYSPEQLFYDVIDCFLFPFLLAAALGAIFCLIKCYWIKEFNNGNDINRHRIIK